MSRAIAFMMVFLALTIIVSEHSFAAQVSFFSYDSGEVPNCIDLAVSQDGTKLYITGSGGIIGLTDKSVLSKIDLPSASFNSNVILDSPVAYGIGFVSSGKLIVLGNRSPTMLETENSDHPLFIVSETPFQVEEEIEISGQITGWEEGDNGNLYVVSGNSGVLTILDSAFDIQNVIQLGGQPIFLLKDATTLLIGDLVGQRVVVFDTTSQSVVGIISLSGVPTYGVKGGSANQYFISGALPQDGNNDGLLMEINTSAYSEVASWVTVQGGVLGKVVDTGNGWLCVDGQSYYDGEFHSTSLLGKFDLASKTLTQTLPVLPSDSNNRIFSNNTDGTLIWAPEYLASDVTVNEIQIIDGQNFAVVENVVLDPLNDNALSKVVFHPSSSIAYIGSTIPVGLWVIDY